jgi:N-acetylglutamate synthase-like GNAT family acetyltransferase
MTADAEINVRAATVADRDMLRLFLSRAAREENIEAYDVLGYLQEFVLPLAQVDAGQIFVAIRAWSIVGLASVVFRQDGEIEIDALLIDPSVERNKIGVQLIAACGAFARSVSAKGLHVTAYDAAKADLADWGFTVIAIDEPVEFAAVSKMRKEV